MVFLPLFGIYYTIKNQIYQKLFCRTCTKIWWDNQFMIFRNNRLGFTSVRTSTQNNGQQHCNNHTYFFHILSFRLLVWWWQLHHHPLNHYIGNLTAPFICSMKSAKATTSCFSTPNLRRVTVLSFSSFSPTTAIIGVFAKDNSRTL